MKQWLIALLTAGLIASACTTGDSSDSGTTSTADGQAVSDDVTEAGPDEPAAEPVDIEVALIWHQHQPRYPVIDEVVSRPWVRVHAAKDYVDMATLVTEFPDLSVTFNLTPVLLDQLVELEAGAVDRYELAASTPIAELTDEQRQFIADRFFDVNGRVVELFPRYVELRSKRDAGEELTDQDLIDLRTLFHLAWLDPEMPEYLELLDRVGGPDGAADFTQDDTDFLLAAHDRLVAEVIPTHAELWADDRIEVITTPLAHPILPLIADTSLATAGDPAALLPADPFREYLDAAQQVERGLDRAEELLGERPVGMWPGEGAVAQPVMRLFAANDVAWVATGEDVLAQSLGLGIFTRDENDTVVEADTLYRPHTVTTNDGPVTMFFRDNRISDLIGFEYSGMPAQEAANDLVARLQAIRQRLADQGVESDDAPLVTIILDGENAWEHYPNDGRDFLRAMYTALTTTEGITTTTPTRYLSDHPDAAGSIDEVFPAAWFSPDFATWIGESEEQRAWELLRLTRLALRRAEQGGELGPEALESATLTMLQAEGSDWFWWYGADQDSGNDRFFDDAYRELLGQVFDAIGEARPRWVDVPIIPDPTLDPQIASTEPLSVTIDGDGADWIDATTWTQDDLDSGGPTGPLLILAAAVDDEQLALRLEGGLGEGFEVYLQTPRGLSRRGTTIDDRLLGFDATHLIRYDDVDGACVASTLLPPTKVGEYPRSCEPIESARAQSVVELGIPLAELGAIGAGDRILVRLATPTVLAPAGGAIAVPAPDIAGFEPVVDVIDEAGDDNGPGSYTYPTDPVFTAGSFDLVQFQSGVSGGDAVFSFAVEGAVANPWGSPVGLSTQTFDVYLDLDPGAGTGRAELLDGRQARLADGNGWEAAITIEGWDSAVATADGPDYSEASPTMAVTVLATEGRVTVRVPLSSLPEGYDPATTAVAVAVLGQEGFPSAGVRRVRDIEENASQWTFGGGDSDGGDTRVIDALDPDGDQADLAKGVIPLVRP